MLKAFRYSGNKTKFLSLYRHPPKETRRIVECYLGSGAYSLNSHLPALCYEVNKSLCEMWWWLQSVAPNDLLELDEKVKFAKTREEKPNVRDMKLDIGPETYVRVNVCSVVVGQLSSWRIYPQHHLPVQSTMEALNRIRSLEIRNESCSAYKHQEGDVLFVDPPYTETFGNYKDSDKVDYEKQYSPADTVALVESTTNPVLFTYGSNAERVFPMYEWSVLKTVRVPNMRKGGTVNRDEKVAYIRWPWQNQTLESLF